MQCPVADKTATTVGITAQKQKLNISYQECSVISMLGKIH